MDLKSTYNKIAEDWVKDHEKDEWWKEGADIFLSMLEKGATVLDVGCAAGLKTHYIAERGYKAEGIDFSDKMIEIAKGNFPELEFKAMDMAEIYKYPKTFDGIFVQAVLLHTPKKEIMNILEKMKGQLNQRGLLYICVKGIKDDGLEEKLIKENDYGYEYERFFSFFSKDDLREYIKNLGMELAWEGETGSGRALWLQVIGRKL